MVRDKLGGDLVRALTYRCLGNQDNWIQNCSIFCPAGRSAIYVLDANAASMEPYIFHSMETSCE
jgi:hypothetical protein